MDCLGEEFAIRSGFSVDGSSCAEGESETVRTVGTAQVRAVFWENCSWEA